MQTKPSLQPSATTIIPTRVQENAQMVHSYSICNSKIAGQKSVNSIYRQNASRGRRAGILQAGRRNAKPQIKVSSVHGTSRPQVSGNQTFRTFEQWKDRPGDGGPCRSYSFQKTKCGKGSQFDTMYLDVSVHVILPENIL
jgi:hypothetical protein